MSGVYYGIETWSDISLEHLVYAYRKAKGDCYFDHTIAMAERFSEYEKLLSQNLLSLLSRLKAGEVSEVLSVDSSQVRIVAKKLSNSPRSTSAGATDNGVLETQHAYFSDAERAFERLVRHRDVVPEFRVIGDFNVEIHVISALWVNTVGDQLDKGLSKSAYGARLRRVRPETDNEDKIGSYHTEALGSFQPYFSPYRKWRKNGLDAIRNELQKDRSVIALSLDLANYYHQIDPEFLVDPRFLSAVAPELSEWEREFNLIFSRFLTRWSTIAAGRLSEMGAAVLGSAGIPIGISATRVISNVLLAELDRDIERGLAPVYYGRYVDDIFLVLRDPGDLLEARDVLSYIEQRTASFTIGATDGAVRLDLPGGYQGKSVLALQPGKQKTFFLSGKSGVDLLDSVEAQIRSVSSERRLMPSPSNLSSMASAKVLSASADASDEADTLRRADGLSVRRLSWALQLRAVEMLARDLRKEDWIDERKEFYRFSLSHILRPDKILDHFDYLPRLLSLAVALTDWADAKRLYEAARSAIAELRKKTGGYIRVNGLSCDSSDFVWLALYETLDDLAREAVLCSLRWNTRTASPHSLPVAATDLCQRLGLLSSEDIFQRALEIREVDWARTPYKQHLRIAAARHRLYSPGEEAITLAYKHLNDVVEFLNACEVSPNAPVVPRVRLAVDHSLGRASLLPYIFPTRPYSTQEISALLPELCVIGDEKGCANNWARFTRAVRGVWVWGAESNQNYVRSRPARGLSGSSQVAYLGALDQKDGVRLGISSLQTDDKSWEAAAAGTVDLSRQRYERLREIVNQAVLAHPRPTYLLLPELSVPERWIGTLSGMLADAGIGLIAGLDYQMPSSREIHSSAVLVLTDTRLGYPATVEVRQVKSLPAPGEDKVLQHKFGRVWTTMPHQKPVYIHGNFAFGVLICSELQNVEHRLEFQGDVDCLMVLSWNQDIDTFSALVESASLDVHANIALVNNRRFGDSRVRIPAKKAHLRDVCRLRGGENGHLVVVSVNAMPLRAFQSRANRWPDDSDPYKPVPEAFGIAPYRRTIPK